MPVLRNLSSKNGIIVLHFALTGNILTTDLEKEDNLLISKFLFPDTGKLNSLGTGLSALALSGLLAGCMNSENTRPVASNEPTEASQQLQTAEQPAAPVDEFAINYSDYETESLGNVWDRIRDGFSIAEAEDHPRLIAELNWYARHQNYLDRVTERAGPFIHYVLEETEKRGLPTELVLLPVVESAYQAFAYSHGRAAGIWQFIPSTGKIYGL